MIAINKSRLVAQGYTQIEGIYFEETSSPITYLRSRTLSIGCSHYFGFKLYQMDIKSAFLNGVIKEEDYIEQPNGFKDLYLSDHVTRLKTSSSPLI